jgi:hypothetical protein
MKVKRGRVYEEGREGNYKENGNWALDNILKFSFCIYGV